jgi:hypothetical protein
MGGKIVFRQVLSVFVATLGVSSWAAGCGDSVAGSDDETITNECGTYDPDADMHGLGPIDPTTPSLVEACEQLCAAFETLEGCSVDAQSCVDDCRLSQCHHCPGSIEPLSRCKADFLDAAACTCADGEVVCELPEECEEESFDTGACGG